MSQKFQFKVVVASLFVTMSTFVSIASAQILPEKLVCLHNAYESEFLSTVHFAKDLDSSGRAQDAGSAVGFDIKVVAEDFSMKTLSLSSANAMSSIQVAILEKGKKAQVAVKNTVENSVIYNQLISGGSHKMRYEIKRKTQIVSVDVSILARKNRVDVVAKVSSKALGSAPAPEFTEQYKYSCQLN